MLKRPLAILKNVALLAAVPWSIESAQARGDARGRAGIVPVESEPRETRPTILKCPWGPSPYREGSASPLRGGGSGTGAAERLMG